MREPRITTTRGGVLKKGHKKGEKRTRGAQSRKRPSGKASKTLSKSRSNHTGSDRRKTPNVKKHKVAATSRATTPARSTHSAAAAAKARNEPLQSPLPVRHIAPPRPV